MKITVKGYITCKEAESYSDCADNYAYNLETNRFAISDGVTKSFFPQIWSKILVENFVALEETAELSIEKCQKEWLNQVTEKVKDSKAKFFTKNAFNQQKPGLATFVSLYFYEKKWYAKALGDSFLFFIPKGKEGNFLDWIYLSSKPKPVVFDNFPDYYSSRYETHGKVNSYEGQLESGTFCLMTDALSEWIFKEENGALREIQEKWIDQLQFESSVEMLRKSQRLNNDDSSVLIIDIEDDRKDGYNYETPKVTNIKDLIDMENMKEKTEVKKEIITAKNSENIEISIQKTENLNHSSVIVPNNSSTSSKTSTIWNGIADINWFNTTENEFIIFTAEQLAGLAKLVNDGNLFIGKIVKLSANIMLNDTTNWQNWANSTSARTWTIPRTFGGIFDGNGKVVSGIYINSRDTHLGLFGMLNSKGVIKNLGVTNSYIRGEGAYIAGLIGENDGGEISDSYFNGTVTGSSIGKEELCIAGLVGKNGLSGRIENCHSAGMVTSNSSLSFIGGLSGKNEGDINNCCSTSSVTGSGTIGSLVGYDSGRVHNKYYDTQTSEQSNKSKIMEKILFWRNKN